MAEIAPHHTSFVDNGDGWLLEVRRYGDPKTRAPGVPPVVFIPGYAMNTYILAYHPAGRSLVAHLVDRGFEVWTANLRGQGGSRRVGADRRFGLRELVAVDLPSVFAHVRARSATGGGEVVAVGCSLGGTLVYAHAALHPEDHGLAGVATLGGPLRWASVHPLLRATFASSRLAGAVPVRGTRRMAELALPWLRHLRPVLGIYLNPDGVDLSRVSDLVPTVDDPVRQINAELARWLRGGEMVIDGVPVGVGLGRAEGLRVLAIYANRDGIVPPSAARSVSEVVPASHLTLREAGDPDDWCAHADLFIGHRAEERVFGPLGDWVEALRHGG